MTRWRLTLSTHGSWHIDRLYFCVWVTKDIRTGLDLAVARLRELSGMREP